MMINGHLKYQTQKTRFATSKSVKMERYDILYYYLTQALLSSILLIQDVTINNIIYGDVWICSGQSNMQWKFGDIFNATEEIEKMKEYRGIRMYQVKMMLSQKQQDDLMEEDWIIWANTSESVVVSQFSAVCLLTARYMADILGKDKVIKYNIFCHFLLYDKITSFS